MGKFSNVWKLSGSVGMFQKKKDQDFPETTKNGNHGGWGWKDDGNRTHLGREKIGPEINFNYRAARGGRAATFGGKGTS